MNENVKVVFGLIGGLALFLYGMNSMSDALQKAAGERMKKILGFLTRNQFMGALAGALVMQLYCRAVQRRQLWLSVLSVRDL